MKSTEKDCRKKHKDVRQWHVAIYHEWQNERTLLLRKNDTLSADLNSMKEKFITFVIAFIIGLIIAIMLFIFRNDIEELYIKAKNSELWQERTWENIFFGKIFFSNQENVITFGLSWSYNKHPGKSKQFFSYLEYIALSYKSLEQCIVRIVLATVVVTRLLESAFSEKIKLKNSTCSKLYFVFLKWKSIFILRKEKNPCSSFFLLEVAYLVFFFNKISSFPNENCQNGMKIHLGTLLEYFNW